MTYGAQQDTYQNNIKITELESLRGLAALLVVLFHIPKWNPILDIGLINNGDLMVDLFFVLSGFVIFSAYSNNINSKRDLLKFQFLRFGRLYPVHFFFIIVYVLIELAKYFAQLKLNIVSPNTQPFRENNITTLVENIFLIEAISPSFNYPSWSISVEFYTYFIFGLSVLFFKKTRILILTTIALVSLILLTTENTFGANVLFRCFAGFFIGCLTSDFTKRVNVAIPSYSSLLIFTLIVIFLEYKTTDDFDVVIYFLTSILIISLVLSKNGILNKILNIKILTLLGTISYSVYMSHAAVLWFVNQTVRVILNKPEFVGADGKMTPQLSQLESIIGVLVIVLSVLIVSYFVYGFIEKPMRSKSRLFASKLYYSSKY